MEITASKSHNSPHFTMSEPAFGPFPTSNDSASGICPILCHDPPHGAELTFRDQSRLAILIAGADILRTTHSAEPAAVTLAGIRRALARRSASNRARRSPCHDCLQHALAQDPGFVHSMLVFRRRERPGAGGCRHFERDTLAEAMTLMDKTGTWVGEIQELRRLINSCEKVKNLGNLPGIIG